MPHSSVPPVLQRRRRIDPRHLVALTRSLRPDADFLIFGSQRLSRRQILAQVDRLAAGLQSLGVRSGDRVVTLLPACPEAVSALLLPTVLGNVEVPLNPLLREHELRHVLADCRPAAVLTAQTSHGYDHPALLDRLLPDLPELRAIVVCGMDEGDGRTFFPWRAVVETDHRPLPEKRPPAQAARIAYTSGTTGLPKGVVHTRDGYWGLARPAVLPRLLSRSMRCLLMPFPLCYYSGYFGLAAAWLSGGKVVLLDRFNPWQVLESIQRERVTQVSGPPTMFRLLLATTDHGRFDLSSVRRVLLSSEPCPPDLPQELSKRFGCPIENVYATNESGHISWTGLRDPWERAATTVGRPVPGASVRIVDSEGHPLPPGQQGEVVVRTSQMMVGYYNDPALTSQALDPDGWFRTGDLGLLDDNGYLRLVGRKKDLIMRGGHNVYPEEVEAFLERHPSIQRAGVIGVPAVVGGEAVWAFLQTAPGASITASEVLDHCRGSIARFKVPEQVRWIESMPTTFSGKVQRYRLREIACREREEQDGRA